MNSDHVRYIYIDVQSALNRVQSSRYPDMRWSLNPYRGCRHGCVYCYARYTHTFFELNPDREFSTVVFVKRNLPSVLRRELRRSSWRREKVHIGTATDPYQPVEGRYRLTESVLRILRDQLTPATLITKNTMALRDADLMRSLHRAAGFSLSISLITLDAKLARSLEPDVPSPTQRLRVVQAMSRLGIPVSVAIAPIMPGLTDSERQLKDLIMAIYDHGGVVGFYEIFRLYADTRKTLFTYLQREHPRLCSWYQRVYGTQGEVNKAYKRTIQARIERIHQTIAPKRHRSPHPTPQGGQLSLFSEGMSHSKNSMC